MLDKVGTDNMQATRSLQELLADLRARSKEFEPSELDPLIEEAREQFYQLRSGTRWAQPVLR